MKTGKTLAASILSIITGAIGGIINTYTSFILWLAFSFADSLSGGEVNVENWAMVVLPYAILILSIAVIVIAIIVLVKREKGLYNKKALLITFMIINAITFVLYVVFIILSFNIVFITLALAFLVVLILLILDFIQNTKALKATQFDENVLVEQNENNN